MQTQSARGDSSTAQRNAVHRLFFALWPDEALRERIDAVTTDLVAEHGTHGRRTPSDRYHLTLQFLGDFEERAQPVIDAAIAAADSVRGTAFELVLNHAGSFGRTRVGWLGAASVPAGLQRLWDALGLALAEHGVTPKSTSSFTPHVTVLRNMRQPLFGPLNSALSWPVSSFVLVDSHPGKGAYTVLRSWSLQQPGAINRDEAR